MQRAKRLDKQDSRPKLTSRNKVEGGVMMQDQDNISPTMKIIDSDSSSESDEVLTVDERRTISFNDNVRVREHNVAIGVHPMTMLPITLGWESAKDRTADIDVAHHSRNGPYALPRHLSYEERRQRLFEVNAAFDNEQCRNDVDSLVVDAREADYIRPFFQYSTTSEALPSDTHASTELSASSSSSKSHKIRGDAIRQRHQKLRRSHSFFEMSSLPDNSTDVATATSLRKHRPHQFVSFDDRLNASNLRRDETAAFRPNELDQCGSKLVRKPNALMRNAKKLFFRLRPQVHRVPGHSIDGMSRHVTV